MKFEAKYQKEKFFKPDWSEEFKYYNQMDQPTFYLAEFIWKHKKELSQFLPSAISIKSPGASYHSDRSFVLDKSLRSPSKFIYTLPSVKTTVICGILKWEGPVYCFIAETSDEDLALFSDWIFEIIETESDVSVKLKIETDFNLDKAQGI